MIEMILEHLKEKYATDFLYSGRIRMNMFGSTAELQVYPQNGNKATDSFYAGYIPRNKEFHDGYYGVFAAKALEALITEQCGGKVKCVAWFADKYFDDKLTTDYPVQKALEEKKIRYTHIEVFSTQNIDFDALKQFAASLKIVGVLNIYSIHNRDYYQSLNKDNYSDYVVRSYTTNPDISAEEYTIGE